MLTPARIALVYTGILARRGRLDTTPREDTSAWWSERASRARPPRGGEIQQSEVDPLNQTIAVDLAYRGRAGG